MPQTARVERLRQRLKDEGMDAFVIFGEANCRYLTGFSGEAEAVSVVPGEVTLVTDSRYTIQAGEQAPAARLVLLNDHPDDPVSSLLSELGGGERPFVVGVESEHLSVKRWERLQASTSPAGNLVLRTVTGFVEALRMIESPDEVEAVREAGRLAAAALRHLERTRVVGRSEREIALDLETWVRRHGSDGVPFPFIVASGSRGAKPHAEPSNAIVQAGELLVVDMGARVDAYASDITRTYCTGPVPAALVEAYELVLQAQAAARAAVRPGLECRDLDMVARHIFKEAGQDAYFTHGLGHGVGLEVHEAPRVGTRSEDVLQKGMVITIEPGLYLQGQAGIRIEDTVLVTAHGGEVLTQAPREMRRLH